MTLLSLLLLTGKTVRLSQANNWVLEPQVASAFLQGSPGSGGLCRRLHAFSCEGYSCTNEVTGRTDWMLIIRW